jgi:hypothetical protein
MVPLKRPEVTSIEISRDANSNPVGSLGTVWLKKRISWAFAARSKRVPSLALTPLRISKRSER